MNAFDYLVTLFSFVPHIPHEGEVDLRRFHERARRRDC